MDLNLGIDTIAVFLNLFILLKIKNIFKNILSKYFSLVIIFMRMTNIFLPLFMDKILTFLNFIQTDVIFKK